MSTHEHRNTRAVVILHAQKMLSIMIKDVLPIRATSNIIYKYVCCCDDEPLRDLVAGSINMRQTTIWTCFMDIFYGQGFAGAEACNKGFL